MKVYFENTSDNLIEIDNLFNHIDEAIIFFNQDGVILKMNNICNEILPYKEEQIIGKSIVEIVELGLVEDPIISMLLELKRKVYKNIIYPDGKVVAFTALPMWNKEEFIGGVLIGRNISIIRAIETNKLQANKKFDEGDEFESISEEMTSVKNLINRASRSDSSIFLTGETGVGKEVVARYIHRNSERKAKPFIAVNCGAIPSELIESEFFGYEEGSFTGAKRSGRAGIIERAHGGTLFLDEIGELSYDMQKKLLRVIQENEVTRVGGSKAIKVNIRYVSATNRMAEEIRNPNRFRQDLYFRLSVIPIRIPALRDRKDDIIPMARYFLNNFNEKYARNVRLSPEVESLMHNYSWLGNVRELKNIVERLIVLSIGDVIGEDQFSMLLNLDCEAFGNKDINNEAVSPIIINKEMNLDEAIRMLEQQMISEAFEKFGSIQKAAKYLGVDPSTIHRKIKKGYLSIK